VFYFILINRLADNKVVIAIYEKGETLINKYMCQQKIDLEPEYFPVVEKSVEGYTTFYTSIYNSYPYIYFVCVIHCRLF